MDGPEERVKRFRPPLWLSLVFVLAGVILVWLGFEILVSGINTGQSSDFLFRAGLVMVAGAGAAVVGVIVRRL